MQIKSNENLIARCCYPEYKQSYIGVDKQCDKNAIFCIQHSCHYNSEGLVHKMMGARQFKRKIQQMKWKMQAKTKDLTQKLSQYLDKMIEQIRQIKVRKCLQLSLLWLRDLASSEEQYELMKQIFRMDFNNITCSQVYSIYTNLQQNKKFFDKEIDQIKSYQGICKTLVQFTNNERLPFYLAQKITHLEGILANGEIIKRVLPDKNIFNSGLKQTLLDQPENQSSFQISYNKAKLNSGSTNYKSFFSKYPLIPFSTYHIQIESKHSNVMVGVCSHMVKENCREKVDLHYNDSSVVFHVGNGNIYKQGMFRSSQVNQLKGFKQYFLKLKVTDQEILLMTKKNDLLIRENIQNIEGDLYLHFLARIQGDFFQVNCEHHAQSGRQQFVPKKKETKVPIKQKVVQTPIENRNVQDYQNINIKRAIQMNHFQTIEQESSLGNTGVHDQQEEQKPCHRLVDKKQENSTYLTKIRESLKVSKDQIRKEQLNTKPVLRQMSWAEEKNIYLKQMREKMNKYRTREHRMQQNGDLGERIIEKRSDEQKSFNNNLNIGPHPNLTEQSFNEKLKSADDSSKIKINLSEQGFSDFTSIAKISLLSGLRKGSDTINADQLKLRGTTMMVQSIEPSYMQKNEKRQTGNNLYTKRQRQIKASFDINQTFEF